MKYIIHFCAVSLFGLPAVVAGYLFYVIRSGFATGSYIADRHEDVSIEKFCKKGKP